MDEEQRCCLKCSAPALRSSRPRGGLEQLLFVLGGSFLRCHACSDRNLYFAGFAIPADTGKRDRTFELAFASICLGVLVCVAIAFVVLRRFHRI